VPSVIQLISHTVVSELTPVAQRGALLAIGTAIGTSAGLLAPYIMGSVVETAATPLAGFNTGFMICGVIMLVDGLIGMALIRPGRAALRCAGRTRSRLRRPARREQSRGARCQSRRTNGRR
jgi:ACS family D-galactonate transporter-like MFS transporter